MGRKGKLNANKSWNSAAYRLPENVQDVRHYSISFIGFPKFNQPEIFIQKLFHVKFKDYVWIVSYT